MQLTDAQWAQIAPLMPTPRGNCNLPTRQVLEGWLFVTKEGCSWRALPERYGPWHTVYMRGRRWMDKGVLERVFAELQRGELEAQLDQREPDRPLRVSIDSMIVKVHQDGTGAPTNKRGRQAIGRSRGGLTTKLHAIVLEDRLPLIMTLTPGHWGDARSGDAGCWSGSAPYLVSRSCLPTAPTRAMRCARWPPNSVGSWSRRLSRAQWYRTLLWTDQTTARDQQSLPQTRPRLLQPDPPRMHPLHDEIE